MKKINIFLFFIISIFLVSCSDNQDIKTEKVETEKMKKVEIEKVEQIKEEKTVKKDSNRFLKPGQLD
jgi:uncharacterized protein YcfL